MPGMIQKCQHTRTRIDMTDRWAVRTCSDCGCVVGCLEINRPATVEEAREMTEYGHELMGLGADLLGMKERV